MLTACCAILCCKNVKAVYVSALRNQGAFLFWVAVLQGIVAHVCGWWLGRWAQSGGQPLPTAVFSYKLRGKENVCKPCP